MGTGSASPPATREVAVADVLGGAAGAGEDHFGLVNRIQRLAIIMGDGEIQGVNALQIALVHLMLAAHPVGFLGAEELSQRSDRPFQNIYTFH